MCPCRMPKWASIPGGGNANVSATSPDVPGANWSQMASSRSTYDGRSASQDDPAMSYGTDWTNSALEWCAEVPDSDGSAVVCRYHSMVGKSGSRPAWTSAHIARTASIGRSWGSRWIVEPNGDGAPLGRQPNDGRADSARLTFSVVPERRRPSSRAVSAAGSGASSARVNGSQPATTTFVAIDRPSASV